MDWRSVRFDWNRARAFLVTAEEGSLSAAARALGMTQPTLGRQVSGLEDELGVALFERVGKGLELTPVGIELVEHVRNMGHAAGQLSLAATGRSQSIEGSICISAVEVTAAYTLPPILHELRLAEPGIDIEVIASNSTSDLKRREADIAVRSFRPNQADLIARKLGNPKARLYGARDYLARLGNPTTPEALAKADFVGFDRTDLLINAYRDTFGLELSQEQFPLISENHLVQWEFVKQGAAIGVMPEEIGDAEPKVERAMPNLDPFVAEVWLVVHRELRTSPRVRRVFDFLADALTRELAT